MAVRESDGGLLHFVFFTEYEWDVDTPKPEHVAWIQHNARDLARRPAPMYIVGGADRSGRVGYNHALGLRRALNIREAFHTAEQSVPSFMASYTLPLMVPGTVGESMAQGPEERWPADRFAVLVFARDQPPPPPPIDWHFTPSPSTVFYVRAIRTSQQTANVGPIGGGIADMIFEISDGFFSQIYRWQAPVGTLSRALFELPTRVPVGVDGNTDGPWHILRTRTPQLVTAFGNTTMLRFGSLGATSGQGSPSAEIVRVELRHPHAIFERFDLGASFSSGDLTAPVRAEAHHTAWATLRPDGHYQRHRPPFEEMERLNRLPGQAAGPATRR